jgi:hypothetical protein
LFRRDKERRKDERRKGERRKEQLPFDGPDRRRGTDRRRGKDRRQYVRRVMSGQEPLPDEEPGGSH